MGVKEAAKLLGLCVSRHCRRQSHAESFGPGQLDSSPGTCPCSLSAMAIVALRRRTIEANLQGYALARQRAQRCEPTPAKHHSVGKDRDCRDRTAYGQDLANIRDHK